jgi:hypothetical protein|tara:strand:+ start:364 stop:597 length:234 start_codon:yes stop_codon:yes gene_type:complete
MFTVEMDHDEIEITVLDDKNGFEDVKVFSYDDIVYIRQFNEQYNKWDLIQMTPEMYVELMTAYHKPSGAYLTHIKRR